ncbi:polysaccharide deacetylase family protein [candidate division KSB1 bacterium]|nr:MAG: polysaccharide deacetylase family protein [candidate division KSB1 bacterium]MBC6948436.1 polysaccharide deacetylase family protein [candidate division KSB1 bacterium]MCE7940202.1 polysaccharide deacetylase family protein [Chlorobi bacterium CHB1]MDL1875589.1 polysaccharide deacetylase family protein [Cytophagia bacterium CHB2]
MNLLARKLLKVPLLMSEVIKPKPPAGCAFLIYHSVAGNLNFELDLPVALFRRQLEFLARHNCVISYDEALRVLRAKRQAGADAVVLTFDDGFVNFYTHVLPILREFNLPATLFVTTGFVETGIPYPLLHHASGAEVKPVTWDMLGEMASSGLVTIGAHTHTHVYLDNEPEDKVIEELAIPQELFRQRLGLEVHHFAYPKALWNAAVEKLVAKYYASAVIGGGYKATPDGFNPYRIPRVPIRCSDGWFFFLAKKRGWLAGEEALYVKVRQKANGKLQKASVKTLMGK